MMTTPTKPTAIAAHRQGPTDSLRNRMPSTGMNSDDVNISTVVSAMGNSENAVKVAVSDSTPSTALTMISDGLLLMTRMLRRPRAKTTNRKGRQAIRLR